MRHLLLLLLFFKTCSAQQKNNTTMEEPTITKDFEKFDYTLFNKYKTTVNPTSKDYFVEKTLESGLYIEMFEDTYRETPKNSYFTLVKGYYKNGNIIRKGLTLNNNIQCMISTWYEFSEDGKLIKETNYDAPYKFTFEQILQFCEKEKIPLTRGPITGGIHTEIARGIDNAIKKNVWYISWFKQSDLIETFVLDAETGKVIDKKYSEYINN
ncbi:hypothetical protein V8245_06465 [Flavobacterium columnare]|uniref:hypothetical protein n=1 Tax=Flavobacterium columnare TaxID=996 RepID=UPI003BA35268